MYRGSLVLNEILTSQTHLFGRQELGERNRRWNADCGIIFALHILDSGFPRLGRVETMCAPFNFAWWRFSFTLRHIEPNSQVWSRWVGTLHIFRQYRSGVWGYIARSTAPVVHWSQSLLRTAKQPQRGRYYFLSPPIYESTLHLHPGRMERERIRYKVNRIY